jgi:hypothetical protein
MYDISYPDRTMTRIAVRSLFALSLSLACSDDGSSGSDDDEDCEGSKSDDMNDDGEDDRRVCAAVRGNGQLITAHFAALARVVEHYGPLWGAAGGSSGSITTFLTESIHMHPLVSSCRGEPCTRSESAARIALLYKSLQGYLSVLAGTEEALALQQLLPIAEQVKAQNLEALAETDVETARTALLDLLTSDDLKHLINDELVELITSSPDPAFHVRDIVGALASFGAFEVDSTIVFVRPGAIDFPELAELIGRIGDFYAGYGPLDTVAMENFLSACAEQGRGYSWAEIDVMPAGDTTCGELFAGTLLAYRALALAEPNSFAHRIDENVGATMPALVSTSVLEGDAADAWRQAKADYFAAQEHTLDVDFADVKFGYWGAAADLARVEANALGYDDAKTAKFRALGVASWREVLSLSPAEPGLARALEIDAQLVSAGGWSDLHPVLVLKNMGCDEVVYVTRRGEESGFADQVATQLGMQADDRTALWSLAEPSGFTLSLEEADAVWCTDWNAFSATDVAAISADAYAPPMVTNDPFFTDGGDAYETVSDGTGLVGCGTRPTADQAD